MKNLFLTMGLAAISAIGWGQDLRKNVVDEFTGDIKKITEFYSVAEGVGTLKLSAFHIGTLTGFYCYSTTDLGCCGTNSNYIIFKFSDNTTLKLDKDIADIDCSDGATSIYTLDPSQIKGKTITKIRIQMSEYYDDLEVKGKYTIQQLFEVIQ